MYASDAFKHKLLSDLRTEYVLLPQDKFQQPTNQETISSNQMADLVPRHSSLSMTQRGLRMLSKSFTVDTMVHPEGRPAANRGGGRRKSIGQMVKAVGARLEAFVTRPFARSGRTSDSRRMTDNHADLLTGAAPANGPPLIRHRSVVTGGKYRASTGCDFPLTAQEEDGGSSSEGGDADLPIVRKGSGQASSIAASLSKEDCGDEVLSTLGVGRRALVVASEMHMRRPSDGVVLPRRDDLTASESRMRRPSEGYFPGSGTG